MGIPSACEQIPHVELWAKSPERVQLAPGEGEYHPLICHMIDSAMVALHVWGSLPPVVRERVRAALGVPTQDQAGRWMAFFIGLHDFGKGTPTFAQNWQVAWQRLLRMGYQNSEAQDRRCSHGTLTAHLLVRPLRDMGLLPGAARRVARTVAGHHGLFPLDRKLEEAKRYAGKGRWEVAHENLFRALAEVLEVDRLPAAPTANLKDENGFLVILAGLTSMADWVASDHSIFRFAGGTVDIRRYCRLSRRRALRALERLGWFHRPAGQHPASFHELFAKDPNPLQKQIMAIASKLKGPCMVTVEYPMSGGKTEAALWLTSYLESVSGQRGVYFALPTMATSNNMLGRLLKYLERRHHGSAANVQLAHRLAELNQDFATLRGRGKGTLRPSGVFDTTEAWLFAAEWFTHRKRKLLAHFGVGTIDQALLGALQTRHFFVRLFGLAGKTVIIDEAHGYDSYMQVLLGRLLSWLAACGSTVIVLSATLPDHTRRALMDAYARGLRGGAMDAEPAAQYPRVSWVMEGQIGSKHISDVPKSQIALRPFLQSEWAWVQALKDALAEGGCAAVIVNTVPRAQRIYLMLQHYFPKEHLYLLHGRYPDGERQARDAVIMERFGPTAQDRPKQAVVVATQVLEQSLDVDFDLMVTDLAPGDLLLQRSGRVWRHSREWRPPSLEGPALWVLMPNRDAAERPIFDKGSVSVYHPHTLLRTFLALHNRQVLDVPGGVEDLVEAIYGPAAIPALSDAVREMWQQTLEDLTAQLSDRRREAHRRYIPDVREDLFEVDMEALDEEDTTLHRAFQAMTRFGGPSVSVVCLFDDNGRLRAKRGARRVVRVDHAPSDRDVRAFLGRSIRIAFSPAVVRRILEEDVPVGWRESPHLRRHRLLRFGPDGLCLNAGLPLKLDPDLGLVVLREEVDD